MKLITYEKIPTEIKEKMRYANVFFSEEYKEYMHFKGDKIVYATDYERIMPIRVRRKYIFTWTVLPSEPFLLVDKASKDLEEYLDEVIRLLEKRELSMWTISAATAFFDDTPKNNCLRIPFGSHVVDLSLSEEELWSKVNSKHRNVIRKATKDGVEIKRGKLELLDDYIMLDEETWKRSNTSGQGRMYYLDQINCLKDNIIVYIAYYNNIPQAGAIFYYNSSFSYYMYGCSSDTCYTGSANLVLWKAMLDMKRCGVKKFSFVGCRIDEDEDSKYHGIQRFKERFGGELKRGYLFRVVSNRMFYKLFCKGMQMRSPTKKPYMDAIDEEINKWSHIQK